MESKIEWHKTSEELPEEGEFVLGAFFNKATQVSVCLIVVFLEKNSDRWYEIATHNSLPIHHINRWVYFPYPTE